MNLAYKKILGKFTKVLGFGKTPPHVGKNSQIISFFFESVPNQFCKAYVGLHGDRWKGQNQLHKIETEVVLILTLVLKGNLAGSFLEGGSWLLSWRWPDAFAVFLRWPCRLCFWGLRWLKTLQCRGHQSLPSDADLWSQETTPLNFF